MVGTQPAGCQSPSVNKALIGCCPVRTGPPEKSNYWLRGFKAAQGRLMKGDKLGTVSRTPAGRPRQPRSRGAAESPRIKGIRRERGSGRTAPACLRPRASLTWVGGLGHWWGLRNWAPASGSAASGAAPESPVLAGKRLGSAGPGQGSGQRAGPSPGSSDAPVLRCGPLRPTPPTPPPASRAPSQSETGAFQSYPGPGARRPRKERRHT